MFELNGRSRAKLGMVLFLLASIGFAQAQPDDKSFDLRGPAPVKGQVFVSKMVVVIKNAEVTIKLEGKSIAYKQTMTITNDEEEKTLAVKGRQVTKSQTRVIKDRSKTVADMDGEKQVDDENGVLEGEVIVSERTGDGKWKHTLVDTKASNKQKKELDKRLGPENDDELYPEEKVKVGHSWTVDAAAMKRFFGNSFTDIKGKLKQTFLRTEEVKGDLCAVIETAGPLTAKMNGDEGDDNMDVKLELKSTSWRSIKTGLEVKGKFEGKIRMSGKQKVDALKADVVIEGPITGNSTSELKE